jgi:aryl-alcohol dehydrogenase-like predicted oxidoreductase
MQPRNEKFFPFAGKARTPSSASSYDHRRHTVVLPLVRHPCRRAATAVRLRCTPAQVALAWLLDLRSEVLLISGTSSISHLEENMAVANIGLDSEARNLLG